MQKMPKLRPKVPWMVENYRQSQLIPSCVTFGGPSHFGLIKLSLLKEGKISRKSKRYSAQTKWISLIIRQNLWILNILW